MKDLLRGLAVLLVWASVFIWIAQGARMGWTLTSRPVEKIDPVTEIPYREYVEGFFPGIDYLGGVVLVSALLYGCSFFVRNKF